MSPLVAALIVSISCNVPPMSFRQFYGAINPFVSGSNPHWSGNYAEDLTTVFTRIADASADFQDYRAGYADKCSRKEQ